MKPNGLGTLTKTVPIYYVLSVPVLLLAVAKSMAIVHVDLTDTLYLDVDRIAALLLFLTLYHLWSQETFRPKLYGVLFACAIAVSALAEVLGIAFEKMLILFISTAFVEEILFRGVLYELLLLKLGPVAVLISSSIFFTLIHSAIYQNLLYALAVLATGLVLGAIYLYVRKRSRDVAIVYATGVHGLIILLGLNIGLI